MKFRSYQGSESAGLQLAPMIDIIFLLLIFFIVSWSYRQFEQELDINVPESKEGKNPERTVGEIILNVKADGSVLLNHQVLSDEELYAKMERISRLYKDQAVILRGDKDTAFHHIVRVLSICSKANIWNVAFATNQLRNKKND